MHTPSQHLDDEHKQRYKWNGAGAGCVVPLRSKRAHPWHASCAVLAVMTTMLLLNGCNNKGPAEQAGAQVDQAVQDMKEQVAPLNENGEIDDGTTQAGPAQEAGRALDEAREKTGEKIEQMGEELQKQ